MIKNVIKDIIFNMIKNVINNIDKEKKVFKYIYSILFYKNLI